eukprot:CAMPEP_0183318872 /NCGR_PEP_ID=MMETSP0160_2-20130417/61923_1 /TAXON_ID=2839 ORGANISM="Odontella Sinensis, Strain Grunow 1884" /NCGR_SAMPLE_ID=MMETSP0160_2 /ASSEMBLY_ACC=CAM_ASM_000250 /LENGTH=306 /DNA_ID=CAMNT_0025485229 /DNA_START=9 /DNA_END=929 /DNA_ORIENTATION=-
MVSFFIRSVAFASMLFPSVVKSHEPAYIYIPEDNADRLFPESYIEYMDKDYGCDYKVTVGFMHDDTLPVPTNPLTQCIPGKVAEDNLQYINSRYHTFPLSKNIRKATGFDHLSIDFNPCGHPPLGVFTIPHYDLHFYLQSVAERQKWTCKLDDNVPVPFCAVDQDSASGMAMYNVGMNYLTNKPANMHESVTGCIDAIPGMGLHCWNWDASPEAQDWVDPIFIMGSYDSKIAFWEPMVPLSFITGAEANKYEEILEYHSQTIESLPYNFTIQYDPYTKGTSLIMFGKSNVCKKGKGGSKASKSGKK